MTNILRTVLLMWDQIDYIMVDATNWRIVGDAGSIRGLDLGSNHFATRISLKLNDGDTHSKPMKISQKHGARWENLESTDYIVKLNVILADLCMATGLDERCQQIEQALQEAATMCQRRSVDNVVAGESQISELMECRRSLGRGMRQEHKVISKLMQSAIKSTSRTQRQLRFDHIIEKGRGFKNIGSIKDGGKRKLIPSMQDRSGVKVSG